MSKIRHHDIEIPTDGTNPFVNCKLERKKYADVLTSIVENYKDGFVLAINNRWGTGKTTFVKMWQQQLTNNGHQTLYFNAWENDFQEEVIIALLSELEELREKDQENFDTLLKKTATFLKKVAPAAIKGAVSKAIGDDAVGEIAAAAMEFKTEEVEQQIDTFNEKKRGIKDFRDTLEKFVDKVDNDKPVVFIIDELDRCRPDYAVKVLEQIKHLFAVPGIIFVLSIDKEQLSNAVRGFYGSDRIDANEYLRRFIDLEYIMPKPVIIDYIEYLYNYFDFDSFINSVERKKIRVFNSDKDFFKKNCVIFFSDGFSLRQTEKVFARIRITLRAFRLNQYVFPQLIVFFAYLKERQIEIYNNIKNVNYSIQELVDKLEPILLRCSNEHNIKSVKALEAILIKFYYNSLQEVKLRTDEKLGEFDVNTGEFKIAFNSKFEGDNHSMSRMLQYYENQFEINDTNLSFILNKYDLTDNLVS